VWGWLRSFLFPQPGPAVTVAPVNIRGGGRQNICPGRVVFENSGTASAFDLEWETRKYNDPILPPTYDRKRERLTAALKVGDQFALELLDGTNDPQSPGSRSLTLADFYEFEIFVRYRNAAKQRFLSYVRVAMAGHVEYHDHAVNPFHRLILPAEIWCRHFIPSLWAHIKANARPRLYQLLKWIAKKTS
jgi:hypothetical protein